MIFDVKDESGDPRSSSDDESENDDSERISDNRGRNRKPTKDKSEIGKGSGAIAFALPALSPNASSPGTKRGSQTGKSLKKKVRSKPRMCQASPPAVPVVTTLQKTIYLWASDSPPLKHHQPMHPQNRCMRPLKHFHLAAEQIYPGWSEQRPFPSA